MAEQGLGLSSGEILADRLKSAIATLNAYVDVDPEIRGGVPVIRDTRIPLGLIFAEVRDSDYLKELADEFDLDHSELKNIFDGLASLLTTPST